MPRMIHIHLAREMRSTYSTIVMLLIFLGPVATIPATALEPQEVAKALDPSVVRILLFDPNQMGMATGTGFVINREGYIVTNFHVAEPHLERGWPMFVVEGGADPEQRRAATMVRAFPGEDLAILRVDGLDRPPVEFSEAVDGPGKGTPVFVIGFPAAGDRLGPVQEASFATGTVSRLFPGSWSDGAPVIGIIQHTAPTNPGNSGGPLANACGQVVGINSQREAQFVIGPGGITLVTDPIQGVFFSSHASDLIGKLKDLKVRFTSTPKSCRSILGVASTNLDIYLAVSALIVAAAISSVFVFRPRPVVQVVVRCGAAVEDCVRAVERAVGRLQADGGIVVRPAVGLDEQSAATLIWVFSGLKGDGEPIEFKLNNAELLDADEGLVIGSDPFEADLLLTEPTISHRHARLVARDYGIGVVDLHSVGGTEVEGKRLAPEDEPTPVYVGGHIKLGNVALTLTRL